VFLDAQEGRAERVTYELCTDAASTHGLTRPSVSTAQDLPRGTHLGAIESDHTEAEFEAGVRHALDAFARGDLFEVVLSQTFQATTDVRPSDLFTSLRALNPAPYGFIMNLVAGEHLVGASPEMFVRVRGRVVETC